MVQKHEVSESVVRRLPRYYRLLQELERQGQAHTSSRELGKRLGMTASQIRQDLSCFGCFGQKGYVYSVTELLENLERIMGLPQLLPAILVGAGNLGQVVAENVRFEQRGFRLIGIFDIKPELVDRVILKELKTVKEQIDTCPASREDLKAEYQFRYDVISEYAPKQMSADEVKAYIQEKFADVLATKNKGAIMKAVMADMKGKADGKVINQTVAELCK